METIMTIVKLIIFLPFIIFLIYLFFRYGGGKLQEMQNGKYMKILDRMPISKDNTLLIVKIGEEAHVIASSHGEVKILMTLPKDKIDELEKLKNIPEYTNVKDVLNKLKLKKDDKQWKKIKGFYSCWF